jgi:hypothetical protein
MYCTAWDDCKNFARVFAIGIHYSIDRRFLKVDSYPVKPWTLTFVRWMAPHKNLLVNVLSATVHRSYLICHEIRKYIIKDILIRNKQMLLSYQLPLGFHLLAIMINCKMCFFNTLLVILCILSSNTSNSLIPDSSKHSIAEVTSIMNASAKRPATCLAKVLCCFQQCHPIHLAKTL